MNKKRILSILLVIAMIVSLLSACGGKKTTKETLTDALTAQDEFKSGEVKLELKFSLNPSDGAQLEDDLMLAMLNNIKLTLEGKVNNDEQRAFIEGDVELGGMAIPFTVVSYDGKLAFNVPMLGQMLGDQKMIDGYVVIDPKTLNPELDINAGSDITVDEKLVEKIVKTLVDSLSDSAVVDKGKTNTTAGDSVKATQIEINIDKDEVKSLLKAAVGLLKDKEVRSEILDLMAKMDSTIDKREIEAELDIMLATADADIDELFTLAEDMFDFSKTKAKLNVFVDGKGNVVQNQADIEMRIKEADQFVDLRVETDFAIWNVNKVNNIEIPTINEQNSIDFEELLNLGLFDLGL